MSAENRLTSIVSYPERGTGGNNRYRGNCSPKLIEDAPESKMLVVEENMARALTLRWGDYDLAKAVSY